MSATKSAPNVVQPRRADWADAVAIAAMVLVWLSVASLCLLPR